MKKDSVQITSVRKAGLTIYESLWLTWGHRKVSVVRINRGPYIKRVNFRENIWAFCGNKRNCPYKAGVGIKRVSVDRGSTVLKFSKRKRKSVCCVHVLYKRLRLGVKTYEVCLCFLAIIFHAMALLCWLLSGFFVLIVLRHSRVSHAGFLHRIWAPQNVKLGIFDHTVAMQWRNVQKSAMQKQSCCFANLNLSLFCLSSWSRRRLCCSSSYQRWRRWRLQHWKRLLKKSEFRAVLNFKAFIHLSCPFWAVRRRMERLSLLRRLIFLGHFFF